MILSQMKKKQHDTPTAVAYDNYASTEGKKNLPTLPKTSSSSSGGSSTRTAYDRTGVSNLVLGSGGIKPGVTAVAYDTAGKIYAESKNNTSTGSNKPNLTSAVPVISTTQAVTASGGGNPYSYTPQAYQSNYTPGTYMSKYGANIESLLEQIQNRKFSYDMDADPLYQQYKDQYIRGGNMAARDAAASAAALSGGYGSSYATTAASQAYDNYLAGLNNKALDLYGTAVDRYNAETDNLYSQLGSYNDLEQQYYGQWKDAEEARFQADQMNYDRWNDHQSALQAAAAQAAKYQSQVDAAKAEKVTEEVPDTFTEQDYNDISAAAAQAHSDIRQIIARQEAEDGERYTFSKQDIINYLNAMYPQYSEEKKSQIANTLVDRLGTVY